jgi:hypothetical protein
MMTPLVKGCNRAVRTLGVGAKAAPAERKQRRRNAGFIIMINVLEKAVIKDVNKA